MACFADNYLGKEYHFTCLEPIIYDQAEVPIAVALILHSIKRG